MQRSAAVFVAALGLFAQAQGMELTKASFASEVKDSGKNAFIKFLAPWCAVCLDRSLLNVSAVQLVGSIAGGRHHILVIPSIYKWRGCDFR